MLPHALTKRVNLLRAGVAVLGVLALAACSPTSSTSWYTASAHPSSTSRPAGDGAAIASPTNGETGVPASTELTLATNGARNIGIVLTDDADGATVDGGMRSDGSSWVPEQALKYNTSFTVRLTSVDRDGKQVSRSSTFTTMRAPGDTDNLSSEMGDGQEYGVGEPIVLDFDQSIPDDRRAAVQKRLFVQTTPPQEGAWNWFSDTEVHYRPKTYWQTGTKITLRALFRGVPLGDGLYGANDLTVSASIVDHDLRITIDDATKTATVTQDGQVIRTMPASLGAAATPSSSGNMVVMTRNAEELFDSANDGIGPGQPGYYREVIADALRLTWGGQYIHSAPWSVAQQGHYDVSHGCTNLNPTDADWLFNVVHVGDPVTVKNTGAPLDWGDGWTDWDRSWDEYIQDSAIPYTGSASTAAFPSPSPSAAANSDGSN